MSLMIDAFVALDKNDRIIPLLQECTYQQVSLTDVSAQSDSFAFNVIEIQCTENCFYVIGSDPTATASGAACGYLQVGDRKQLIVPKGYKIAAILPSGAGTLYISELG